MYRILLTVASLMIPLSAAATDQPASSPVILAPLVTEGAVSPASGFSTGEAPRVYRAERTRAVPPEDARYAKRVCWRESGRRSCEFR